MKRDGDYSYDDRPKTFQKSGMQINGFRVPWYMVGAFLGIVFHAGATWLLFWNVVDTQQTLRQKVESHETSLRVKDIQIQTLRERITRGEARRQR